MGIGRLSTPALTEDAASFLEPAPKDEREKEVLYAALLGALVTSWGVFEVASFVNHDAERVSFLLVFIGAASIGLDVYLRQGQELRMAAAGLERLTLRDSERESHCEAAAFLAGYLMGLPCFCFQPDAMQALRMFSGSSAALSAFKQPLARSVSQPKSAAAANLFDAAKNAFGSASKPVTEVTLYSIPELPVATGPDDDVLALGRVLVWLMAPVAAEKLKYGKSQLSDPRRCGKFFGAVQGLRDEAREKLATNTLSVTEKETAEQLQSLPLPASEKDRDALLRWAYFEAAGLVRQYGDLLEELRAYLQTGTSSVGECVLLIEEELR